MTDILDTFTQPVRFTMNTGRGPKFFNGSACGSILSITIAVFSIAYLSVEMSRMYSYQYDTIKTEKFAINF